MQQKHLGQPQLFLDVTYVNIIYDYICIIMHLVEENCHVTQLQQWPGKCGPVWGMILLANDHLWWGRSSSENRCLESANHWDGDQLPWELSILIGASLYPAFSSATIFFKGTTIFLGDFEALGGTRSSASHPIWKGHQLDLWFQQ